MSPVLLVIAGTILAIILFAEAVAPRKHPLTFRTRFGLLAGATALLLIWIVVLAYT